MYIAVDALVLLQLSSPFYIEFRTSQVVSLPIYDAFHTDYLLFISDDFRFIILVLS
jgi:hypothetical protein